VTKKMFPLFAGSFRILRGQRQGYPLPSTTAQ
jgi:hypothetical protein